MASWIRLVGVIFGATALTGCSMVDTHLEERITAVNKGVNAARNEGILLNVIRAGNSEPLSFVAISKISGSQNTDVKLGLPTITIGKGQTTAQKQAVFGSNSWENSAQSSFDSAPLESGDFYKAMSSSVDLGTMEALIRQGYSRELVFNALIGSIRVTRYKSSAFEFRNDPLLNNGCATPGPTYGDMSMTGFKQALDTYSPGKSLGVCEFRHFEFLLQAALEWGLTIEAVDPPKAADTDSSGVTVAVSAGDSSARASAKPAAAAPAAVGGAKPSGGGATKTFRFCFDEALADPKAIIPSDNDEFKPLLCGAAPNKDGSVQPSALKIYFGTKSSGEFTFDIRPRSGLGLFRYIAHAATAGAAGPRLYLPDSKLDFTSEERTDTGLPLINILEAQSFDPSSCFVRTYHSARVFCVPSAKSTSTRQMFALVAQLLALDTTATALPTTLDVRLQ